MIETRLAEAIIGYILVLLATVFLHEILHLTVARTLGYKASLKVTRKGFAIIIDDYINYKRLADINDAKLKRHYLIISLAPYLIIPLYAMLVFCVEGGNVGISVALKTTIIYHLLNVVVEFYQ